MKIFSKSEKETYNFAKKFATTLQGGEVLCLIGDLGAGKTIFTKGLAVGLGIKNIITSPTFVLMKNYKVSNSKIKYFIHVDAYRLEGEDQFFGIGVEDYFNNAESITIIEWADRIKGVWPQHAIKIEFKIGKENKREIKINKCK